MVLSSVQRGLAQRPRLSDNLLDIVANRYGIRNAGEAPDLGGSSTLYPISNVAPATASQSDHSP